MCETHVCGCGENLCENFSNYLYDSCSNEPREEGWFKVHFGNFNLNCNVESSHGNKENFSIKIESCFFHDKNLIDSRPLCVLVWLCFQSLFLYVHTKYINVIYIIPFYPANVSQYRQRQHIIIFPLNITTATTYKKIMLFCQTLTIGRKKRFQVQV